MSTDVDAANFKVLLDEITLDTQRRLVKTRHLLAPTQKLRLTLPTSATRSNHTRSSHDHHHHTHDARVCRNGDRCPLTHVEYSYTDACETRAVPKCRRPIFQLLVRGAPLIAEDHSSAEATSIVDALNKSEEYAVECRAFVVQLFEDCAPHRLPEVDDLMKRFSGKLDELMDALEKQYYPTEEESVAEPLDPMVLLLREYFELRAPQRVPGVEYILSEFHGDYALLDQMLRDKYGNGILKDNARREAAVPREDVAPDYRAWLVTFYEKYAPDRVDNVDELLGMYGVDNARGLNEELKRKYGVGFL